MSASDQQLSPSQDQMWQEALRACIGPGSYVVSLDDSNSLDLIMQLVSSRSEAQERIVALASEWITHRRFAWFDTMVRGPGAADRGTSQNVNEENPSPSRRVLAVIRALCDRVVNVAVVLDDTGVDPSLNAWSYLVQLVPPAPSASMVRLHHPATESDIHAAAQALPFTLPASFTAFCQLTNGLDLDARGRTSINGVGPSRADWQVVTNGDWRACQRYREIVAQWRAFHGMYEDILAYEAEQDAEGTAVLAVRSRMRGLAPIELTTGGDSWCLGVEEPHPASEECPVVYWDHETRDLTQPLMHANFGEWLGACLSAPLSEHGA